MSSAEKRGDAVKGVAIERAFGLFLLFSMGLFTVCICAYVTIVAHRGFTSVQAKELNKQAEALGERLLLYVENREAVLKGYAELPLISHAVMQPETSRANVSDFMDSLSLLGSRPQLLLFDFEGQLIHATRKGLCDNFYSSEMMHRALSGSVDGQTFFLSCCHSNRYIFIAVPVLCHGTAEGLFGAAIPLDELGAKLGFAESDPGSQLQLFCGSEEVISFGGGEEQSIAHTLELESLGVRLVYKTGAGEVKAARNRLVLSMAGAILIVMMPFVGLAVFWGRRTLIVPLERFRAAASRITQGAPADWSGITDSHIKEIRRLGADFEIMAGKVLEREAQLRTARDSLQKRVEEQTWDIQESRERYALVLEGTRAGFWDWNVQAGLLIVNERWAEICGYTLSELEPISIKTWEQLAHPDDLLLSLDQLERHFKGESPYYEVECRMKHKDGHWVWVHDRGMVATWSEDGLPLRMTGTHADVTDRKRAEEELEHISRIQELLMRLATVFVNVSVVRQDEAIDIALESIGGLIGADRAYLFKYDFSAGVMSNTHEWCAQGIAPEVDNLQAVPMEVFPDWVGAHRNGELVHIPKVSDLPESSSLRVILEPQGIRSLITLPLMCESVCFGFVGFDAVNELRAWREEEIGLLRVLAEMFANFESRRVGEEMVSRLNAEQSSLIVEMKKMQQNLIRARDEAQSAARAKSMFLANMSHEIRTPLNAILGYAQIINRSGRAALPAEDRKGVDVIMSSGRHLLHLINDILALARNENQLIDLNKSAFDFHALMEEIGTIFEQKNGNDKLAISLECLPGVPQFLYSDMGKIRQVMINLIGNALKFTEQGWIRVSASTVASDELALDPPAGQGGSVMVAVRVEDTGRGIPADQLESIFSPFEQTKNGQATGLGTGLGLTISRQYARALGGDVTAESEEGQGSSFLFIFKAALVADHLLHDDGRVVALASGQPERRLLLVEDDVVSRNMLESMLRMVGFEVQVTTSGEQALELLAEEASFDAVLMDKKMPGIDGIEAMRRLRELPGRRHLPVLIVTASGMAGEEEKILQSGAAGFVPKPVHESHLFKEIQRVAGVEYRYEGDADSLQKSAAPDVAQVGPGDTVPDALVDEALDALHHGRVQRLRTLIVEMEIHHPDLVRKLRELIEKYDYEALEELFNHLRRKPYESHT